MRARADLLKEPMDLCEDSNAYTILRCSRDLTQRCARCRYHKIFIRKRPRRARRTVYIARAREGQTGMHDVGTRSIHVHVPLEDRALSIIPARARSRSRAPAPIPDIVPRTNPYVGTADYCGTVYPIRYVCPYRVSTQYCTAVHTTHVSGGPRRSSVSSGGHERGSLYRVDDRAIRKSLTSDALPSRSLICLYVYENMRAESILINNC